MSDLTPFGSGSILERAGANVTLTSLTLNGEVSYEVLTELLAFAGTVHKASSWWIGDTLNQIEMRYGDKVYQAASVLDLREQTIMNIMSVCSRVPRSRRREALKFSHHQEVASLSPEDQVMWLQAAEDNGWKKEELRKAIKGHLLPAVEVSCTCPTCGHTHSHEIEKHEET